MGRVVLATGILVGALFSWLEGGAATYQARVASVAFVVALVASAVSFWRTDVREVEPGADFLYLQVVIDVLLATAIVHITGGQASVFAPLFILVIAEGALLLPLPGGVLIGGLASLSYLADILWFQDGVFRPAVGFQLALFVLVAFATGYLGDRVRRAGLALGAVESELRQLRLDTVDILANLSTGVLTVDGMGRLAYLNPAGEALLALDAGEWRGAPVMDTVEALAPGLGTVLRRCLEDGTPVSRFKTVLRRPGRPVVLGVSTAVLAREDGRPPSATAIFQDITDSDRLEALHRRTARLEAVAELSASLAHEIKNPLASIRSAVEQLTRSALEREDRELLEELVLSESDRLSRLLSEFLEFSALRIQRAQRVDLSAVVKGSVALVRQHPDRGDDVTIRCEGVDDPVLLRGDADLLHRAVFNLVLNAVQFSPADSEVVVALERSPVDPGPEGHEMAEPVRLTVRDRGPGVEPDVAARIFDPFFTTRSGGSGLGLAVVHRAVEAHSGAVAVESPPGGGAEFVIYLPGGVAEGGPPSGADGPAEEGAPAERASEAEAHGV